MPNNQSLSRNDTLGLILLSLGVALVVVDISIVNLVLPQIAKDLELGFSGLQYVSALFSLAAAAVVIAAGDIGDRIGVRRAYLGGLGLFLGGSLMAALAPSEPVMLAARVVQGVGGGVALTAVLGLINASYHGRARGIAFALYGATFAAACAAGPLLGAAIAETVGWRWAFGVNLIVGPLAFAGVVKLVPAVAPGATRRPDIAGMVLASGAVTAITFAIVQAQSYGWIHAERTIDLLGITFHQGGVAPTPVVFGLAAVLFAAFALVERVKIAREQPAILDPALIRVRSFTHGSIGLLIVGMGEFGLVFLLPLALQAGAGLTAMEAGLLMLPTSVAAVVAFPLVQQLVTRTDQRTAVLVGLVLEAVGLTGIALAAEIGHPLAMLPGLAVYGLGIGAATAQLSALVLTEVPAAHNSLASGLSSAARHLGSSLGVAVLGVLFSAPLAQVSEGLADQPVQTVTAMHAAGQDTLIARASDALGHGVCVAGLAAAAFLLIGAVAIRGLPRTMAHPELAPSGA